MRIVFLLLAFIAPLTAQDSPIHVLQQQQAAWNRHDLEAFLAGYWNSPDLTFSGPRRLPAGRPLSIAIAAPTRARAARWGNWTLPI